MSLKFLTYDEFSGLVAAQEGIHWSKDLLNARWTYHESVVRILEELNLDSPDSVLEVGTMGAQVVSGSKTMDLPKADQEPRAGWLHNCHPGDTIFHDARSTPWPFHDKQFEVVVALRVLQHLTPCQETALRECFRVANHVIIVVDYEYSNPDVPTSAGVTLKDLQRWSQPNKVSLVLETGKGHLIYWDASHERRGKRLRKILSGRCRVPTR